MRRRRGLGCRWILLGSHGVRVSVEIRDLIYLGNSIDGFVCAKVDIMVIKIK